MTDIQERAESLYPATVEGDSTSAIVTEAINEIRRPAYIKGATEERALQFEFIDWLPRHAMPRSINRNWILNSDQKEYTTEQLFETFLNGRG